MDLVCHEMDTLDLLLPGHRHRHDEDEDEDEDEDDAILDAVIRGDPIPVLSVWQRGRRIHPRFGFIPVWQVVDEDAPWLEAAWACGIRTVQVRIVPQPTTCI